MPIEDSRLQGYGESALGLRISSEAAARHWRRIVRSHSGRDRTLQARPLASQFIFEVPQLYSGQPTWGLHRSLLLRSTITPPAPIPAKRTAANGIVTNEATPTARRTTAASGRAVRAILVRPGEARRLGSVSSFGAARLGRSVTSFVSASMVSAPSVSVSTLVCAVDTSATRSAS